MSFSHKPEHDSIFEPAFFFSRGDRRDALSAVYAFCREADDLSDEPGLGDPALEIAKWRDQLERIFDPKNVNVPGAFSRPLAERLARVASAFALEKKHFLAVLEGAEAELSGARCRTGEDLERYLDRRAGAVAMMCVRIFGAGSSADDYAVALGRAVHLTILIRDVFEDARRGRVHLPLEDAKGFGVSENDILACKESAELAALLEFEAGRAREYYARLRGLRPPELKTELFPAQVTACVYEGLLRKMERRGFGPRGRVRLNAAEKLFHSLRALR